MTIQAGHPAPDFELPDENGVNHRLSEYRGKPVVLYFYPKDDTPGCTKEACSFRDGYSEYKKAGVVVIGISPDNSLYHLLFWQIMTMQSVICSAYGVVRNLWVESTMVYFVLLS
jgi:peroxiredoxin Q/BCP